MSIHAYPAVNDRSGDAMIGVGTWTLVYLCGQGLAAALWLAELANQGWGDKSWIAPTIAAAGAVLVGLAGKLPPIIRAWKEEPKKPRAPRKTPRKDA